MKLFGNGGCFVITIIFRYRDYPAGTTSYGRYDPLIGTPGSPPVGGISFPPGMFDKYVGGLRLQLIIVHIMWQFRRTR